MYSSVYGMTNIPTPLSRYHGRYQSSEVTWDQHLFNATPASYLSMVQPYFEHEYSALTGIIN